MGVLERIMKQGIGRSMTCLKMELWEIMETMENHSDTIEKP